VKRGIVAHCHIAAITNFKTCVGDIGGQFSFRKYFCGVFELIMQRNGQKRDKKNRRKKTTGKKGFFLKKLFDFFNFFSLVRCWAFVGKG
jgi:hypothetical protein